MPNAKTTAVVVVIAAQVTVPLVALVDVPPTPFGFQMYSAQGYVMLDVMDSQHNPVDIDVEDLTAGTLRPTLNWTGALPEHVCDQMPTAAQVTVEQREWSRTIQCD